MLRKMTIRNFKAIQNMTIEFSPLTVLIGGNACGKTTILQALDFLRSVAIWDIPVYLKERGWTFDELKSQFDSGREKPVEFISNFDFEIDGISESIQWTFIVNHVKDRWQIKEEIVKTGDNSILFSRGYGRGGPVTAGNVNAVARDSFPAPGVSAHNINEILLEASWLKYLRFTDNNPLLFALKNFLTKSTFFGLLSPDSIRKGNNYKEAYDVGSGGISVAPFIHCLSDDLRKTLNGMVSQFAGFPVAVNTIDLGGKIELYIEEKYKEYSSRINKDHISDGLLRIIAFTAIAVQKKEPQAGIISLDEIENGINPYLAEKISGLLNDITKTSGRQVIITTHSPVIVNGIAPESIVFLWKQTEDGAVNCEKMFSTKKMKELLDALNPGEVWLNLEKEQIIERLGIK
jgi:predicted ATPase